MMALKGFQGFDYEQQSSDMARHLGAITWSAGSSCTIVAGRRDKGYALSTDGVVSATLSQQASSQFVGFAWELYGGEVLTIGESTSGDAQIVLTFGSDNHNIIVTCGDTTLYTSDDDVWEIGNWTYLEIWPVIDSSDGSLSISVNAGASLSKTISGIDTQNTDNAYWDTIKFDGSASGELSPIDDFYWGDATDDSAPITCVGFMGDCAVVTMFANGNSDVEWTPGTGLGLYSTEEPILTNWQTVSERNDNVQGKYNTTTVVGNSDTLNFGVVDNYLNAVIGLSTTMCVLRSGNAKASIQPFISCDDVESTGDVHTPTDIDYVYYTDYFTSNPSTSGTLTIKSVNKMKAGYTLTAI